MSAMLFIMLILLIRCLFKALLVTCACYGKLVIKVVASFVKPEVCNKGNTGEASVLLVIRMQCISSDAFHWFLLQYEYVEVVNPFLVSYIMYEGNNGSIHDDTYFLR